MWHLTRATSHLGSCTQESKAFSGRPPAYFQCPNLLVDNPYLHRAEHPKSVSEHRVSSLTGLLELEEVSCIMSKLPKGLTVLHTNIVHVQAVHGWLAIHGCPSITLFTPHSRWVMTRWGFHEHTRTGHTGLNHYIITRMHTMPVHAHVCSLSCIVGSTMCSVDCKPKLRWA
jgi:hypothetical protein